MIGRSKPPSFANSGSAWSGFLSRKPALHIDGRAASGLASRLRRPVAPGRTLFSASGLLIGTLSSYERDID